MWIPELRIKIFIQIYFGWHNKILYWQLSKKLVFLFQDMNTSLIFLWGAIA